jgi:arginyl-tRNA synthetase
LRQLALAKSLSATLPQTAAKFVALLGASLGVYKFAVDELNEWFDFVGYKPELYYDVLMPKDKDIVPRWLEYEPCATTGCEMWDGPKGPVIVTRSDGRPTYAFADIAFAKTVGPTHYITGAEQQDHFASLGLGEKHLPMGLVLGSDNKKMKSRTGANITAAEIIQQIIERLDPTPEPKKLAWNVLAWNLLHVARPKNVKFTPDEWTKPEAPGMYITYTCARIKSALKGEDGLWFPPWQCKVVHARYHPQLGGRFEASSGWGGKFDFEAHCKKWSAENPDPAFDLTQTDADLIGFAKQYNYVHCRCIEAMDPAQLANYAYTLAAKLGVAYHSEKISGGRYGFKHAIHQAVATLRHCMWNLGMFDLEKV